MSQREVFAALKRLGRAATAKEIIEELAIGTDQIARSNISLRLRRLATLGYINKLDDGRYQIVEEFPDSSA
jgi:predicted transcriptional regulator